MSAYPPPSSLAQFNPATQSPSVLEVNGTTTSNIQAINENGTTTAPIKIGSDGSLQATIREPLSGFGELPVIIPQPRIQIDAIYGILSTDIDTQSATGGTADSINQMFRCQSGVSVGGYSVIRSKNIISYRAGQSIRVRFTASYTAGVALSLQGAGPFNATNGFFVGYQGTQFGIWRRQPGTTAIYRLTFTVGTGGNETHSITLNGVLTSYATVGVLSTSALAENIAENITPTGWTSSVSPRSNGATITFIQGTPGTTPGTFTYSSTGTATATFSQLTAGTANDDSTYFVPQTSWNIDKLDGSNSAMNPTGELLDKTKLNIWQVVIPYLGAGSIKFYRGDSESHMEAFHVIEYSNQFTTPSQSNPSYRIGWISASLGSTTNLTVQGASGAGFIEGDLSILRSPFSFSGTISAGTTEYVIFAIRGRGDFLNRNNQKQILLLNLSASLDTSNRIATINVYANPTLTAGTTNWQYINQSLSCVEYCSPTTLTPSGGIIVQSFTTTNSTIIIDLQRLNVRLTSFDTFAISCKTTSGSSTVLCSLNWAE